MSESNGGHAVREVAVSNEVIQVRLRFESRNYDLASLARRIQDVEALMNFLLAPKLVLNGSDKLTSVRERQSIFRSRNTRATQARALGPMAYKVANRHIRSLTRSRVDVERVSLNSPLEIIMTVSAGAAALGGVVALLPKMIDVKNKWNDSRVQRAESNIQVDRIELERRITQMVSEQIDAIDPNTYFSLPADHPSKQIVRSGIRALSSLDEAEAEEK